MIHPADLKDDDVWAMLSASRAGDLEQVKAMVERRPDLVTCEYNYTPPLHFAVREGHLELVRFLLDRGADLNYKSYAFGDTYLVMAQDRDYDEITDLLTETLSRQFPVKEGLSGFLKAASNGDLAQVLSDIRRDPEIVRGCNGFGETALHKAVEDGRLDVMLALIDAGAVVDAARADGLRPINCALRLRGRSALYAGALAGVLLGRGAEYNIYLAAVFGDMNYVQAALSRDSSLANFEDTSHARPISAAARRNDLEMVRLLLDHGANPSLREEGAPLGQALWIAVYQRQKEMAKLLLEHGANPNTSPESSGSALFQARGDEDLTQLLIQYGAEEKSGRVVEFQRLVGDNNLAEVERMLNEGFTLNDQDSMSWGEGVLASPANRGSREMIQLLMKHGARVPDISKWGRFYYFKHTEIAELLLDRGMNPNHMNWHNVTMLHDMAQAGDIPKAKLLLDHGADIDPIDEEYRSTPLGLAARWGNREMVQFLLARGADPNKSTASWSTPSRLGAKEGTCGSGG